MQGNKNIVNLTTHELTFFTKEEITRIPSSGIQVRVKITKEKIGEVNGLIVNRIIYGEVEGLPDRREDTIYVVPAAVAKAVPERDDVFYVDNVVRDYHGRIVGCTGLAHI